MSYVIVDTDKERLVVKAEIRSIEEYKANSTPSTYSNSHLGSDRP